MAHVSTTDQEHSSKKWMGIPETQLEAVEAKQRQRIQALEDMLQLERLELASIIAARSGVVSKHGTKFVAQLAPQEYSPKLTWKDKILFVIKEAGKPMHGKEIGPALLQLQPRGLKYRHIDNTVSVHLTKLVRDGAVVRLKVKGGSGSFYELPG